MFEKYNEKARRVIFFARYEASQFGSAAIEPEHILLGLIREDHQFIDSFLRASLVSADQIRRRVEKGMTLREKIPASVDLPLSGSARMVLQHAAKESDLLQHSFIGTEHLLLGLLRQENTTACAILQDVGLSIDIVREEVKRRGDEMDPSLRTDQQSQLTRLTRQMRALASAMIEKCDELENRLRELPPEGGEND